MLVTLPKYSKNIKLYNIIDNISNNNDNANNKIIIIKLILNKMLFNF